MKRELLTVQLVGATTTVLCPPRHTIRVLSVMFGLSAGPSAGDIATVQYSFGNFPVLFVPSQPMTADIATVQAAVGIQATSPMLDSTVVATGVAVYSTTPNTLGFALPDVTFDKDVTLTCAVSNATVAAGTVLYERTSP